MGQARTYMYGYTELFMQIFLELLFNLPMNWYEEFIVHFTHDTFVRLNLFNHVLALSRVKFACISAIKYPVFKWELCKGCM